MRDFQFPGRSPVLATEGMCATSHPLAAQAAIRILQDGGNAVDAAIAGAVLLGFAEPQSCGIGGDCFVLLKPAGDDRIVALNGSGRAPAGLSAAALRDRGLAAIGTESIESVTVPGAVDALCRLSEDWGRVGMAASLAPAIHYAEAGVPVAPRVAFDWPEAETRLSGAARGFYLDQGKALCVGQVFRSPGQAEVLRRIASEGRAGFYSGEVAEDMVASLKAAGGSHTLEDFAATACAYTDPVSGSYRDHDLVEHPPNGQGATAILMLNILSHFDLPSLDPLGAARAHLEAEATRLAYDARDRFIADPDHTSRLGHMLAPETAAGLAALIDPSRAMDRVTERTEAVHRDTVYITVVDRDRMAVSLIYSTYWGFGSGIASDRFGILFQNRGAGFTLTPGHPNEAGGGKRPMHTIIPAMLCQGGRVRMPFGVMGGAYQPAGQAHVLQNMFEHSMDPQQAIDFPRLFWRPDGVLAAESGITPKILEGLAGRGHEIASGGLHGGGQMIAIDRKAGVLIGASDPRKDGHAGGY